MDEQSKLAQLIHLHCNLYSDVGIQDIYKMLYQGLFGAEHLLKDSAAARERLYDEWQSVEADVTEQLIVPVSVQGDIVRVNLCACKAMGLSLGDLWKAFFNLGQQSVPERKSFEPLWRRFLELCDNKIVPFDADLARQFGEEAQRAGYPARHHSSAYRAANQPAYRIVRKSEIVQWVNEQGSSNDKVSSLHMGSKTSPCASSQKC